MKKEYIISHSELRKLQSETEIEINDDISSKYYEIDFNNASIKTLSNKKTYFDVYQKKPF